MGHGSAVPGFGLVGVPARRDSVLRRALAGADVLAVAITLTLVTKLVGDDRWHILAILALPLILPIGKLAGLYDRDQRLLRKSTLQEAPGLLRAATAYTLLLWIAAPLLFSPKLGRGQILAMISILLVLLLALRLLARRLVLAALPPERCLLLGERRACERVAAKLEGHLRRQASIELTLPFDSALQEAQEMRRLARGEELGRLVAAHGIDRIIIAARHSDAKHIPQLVQAAGQLRLNVSLVPRMLEVVGSSVEFDDLDGLTVLGVKQFGLPRSSKLLKRCLDISGALAGLVLLSPLLAVIAIIVRLDSPGPVLFSQRRVGQDGRAFSMLKFRTMIDGAEALRKELAHLNEADGIFKIEGDPRITRVGRLLRRLCLDELPQLFNVLRGEMSLVGPRPLILDEDSRIEGFYRQRLSLTPGMTGRWQILGSARIPLSEMVKLDYLYVANWSLWSDVQILLRTVPYVVERRGM